MAYDLKIEIFAYTIFHKTWLQLDMIKTKPDIFQIYGEECCKVESINEACDDLYFEPVICRRKLFKRIYLADLTDEKVKSFRTPYECYNYVISTCNRDDLFGELTVFERMFATCAFVLNFCICIRQYNIVDVIQYGHMFWAMYFDRFTEEFYEDGGWPELQVVAETYSGLHGFICWFKEESFFKLREAIDNYFNFFASNQYYEFKRNQKTVHASKQWIKFRIEQFENYKRIPITDRYLVDAYDVEDLLEDSKEMFQLILEENSFSTDIECSETSTDHSENETDYINGDGGSKNLPERRCEGPKKSEVQSTNQMHGNLGCRNFPPYIVLDTTLFCSENEGASGNKEVNTEKTLKTDGISKNGDDCSVIYNRKGAIPTSQMTESECNVKLDNLVLRNTEIQFETSNAPEVLFTNRIDKSLHWSKPHPKRVIEMTNICFQDAVVIDNDEMVRKEKTLEGTHNSKKGNDKTEIAQRTGILSASSKMNKSDFNVNSFPHLLPTKQFIDLYVDNLYARNTEIPSETSNPPEVSSTIQMAVYEK